MRFSSPSAFWLGESAFRLGSTRSAVPLRPFSDPWGFGPHHALRPCFMPLTLMGFLLSGVCSS